MIKPDNRFIYQTERVGVRGLCREELGGNYPHWFNDLEVCRYNSHGLFPATRSEIEKYVDSLSSDKNKIVWAVFDKQSHRHIGNISLQSIHWINRTAEFAVIMGEKDYWGKGYSHEAAKLLFLHGFKKLNLHRIYCGAASLNISMQNLAKALYMQQEGVRREALFIEGKYYDLYEYGVLKDEFLSKEDNPYCVA